MERMIFFRVGRMKHYAGYDPVNDPIRDGGSFVDELGYGWEIYNFEPYQGRVYGYTSAATIDVPRIVARRHLPTSGRPTPSHVDNVLVVWAAKNPDGPCRQIVGWYRNARVYRKQRERGPDGANRTVPSNVAVEEDRGVNFGYNALADVSDAVLLAPEERSFVIPTTEWGESPHWFADSTALGRETRDSVLHFINDYNAKHPASDVDSLESHSRDVADNRRKYGPDGEGEDHRALKEWCAANPAQLSLDVTQGTTGIEEYPFKSGDVVDVLVELRRGRSAVIEVEPSPLSTLEGAHQALKYRVLRCAQQGRPIDSSAVEALLVAPLISPEALEFCNDYGIKPLERPIPEH